MADSSARDTLLKVIEGSRGRFNTVRGWAAALPLIHRNEADVQDALDELFITLRIEQLEVISADGPRQFYGIFRGVQPGTARINQVYRKMEEQ